MNIDKAAMENAWLGRANRKQYNELLGYIDELANYFASHFKIHPDKREDILQDVRMAAVRVIEQYSIDKKSTAFSFFYRTINVATMYYLRKDYLKNQKRVTTCSYDVISNSIGDEEESDNPYEPTFVENEQKFVQIDGNIYIKEDLIKAAAEAKKLCRKKDFKISSIEDPLVLICAKKIAEKPKTKAHKK